MDNSEKLIELEKLARPLAEFLKKHYNPHCAIVIDFDTARIVADEMFVPIKD